MWINTILESKGGLQTDNTIRLARLKINIDQYEWCSMGDNEKIKTILREYKKLGLKVASKYTVLDPATRESVVYESALDVCDVLRDDYRQLDDIKNLYCTIIRNKCNNIADYENAKKRGGEVIICSLEEQYSEQQYSDTNILDTETILYIQQLKDHLTAREYEFINLLIKEPHLLTNTEYASIMEVSEATIRKMKKNLQTKIFNQQ